MVRYILGRAGKGKTRYIFGEIAEALEQKHQGSLILLVPEQYTLQAERDLINSLRLPGLIRLEVMSPTRLAERVFEEVGGNTSTLIDNQGRQMAIRRSVDNVQSRLSVYQRASKLPGFIGQCADLLSELKQNLMGTDELSAILGNLSEDRLLAKKIQDTILIYKYFNDFMSELKFMDSDDYLLLLMKKMHQSDFLKHCRLWIDGFTTFSPISEKIIMQLMSTCSQTNITLCMDAKKLDRDRDLFQLPQKTLGKFNKYCRENGIEERYTFIDPEQADRQRQRELLHLEQELMAFPGKVYDHKIQALSVRMCSNIHSEVDMAARSIIAAARDNGWRWRDMTVVCADINSYGFLVQRTFQQYGIPCFLDLKRSISNNPLVRFILSCMDVIIGRYRSNDIISLLKTGLASLDSDEWEDLENYALQYGINGLRWKDVFKWGEDAEREKNELARNKVIKPLLELEQAWTNASGCRSMVAALFDSMENQGVGERLEAMITAQVDNGTWELAMENAQIWNIVWQIMDQLLLLAADIDLTMEEFRQLLETGFRSYELAIIPPMVDQVLVGNIGRSKSQDVKAVFILGCNDGVLPSNMPPEGLLNNEERRELLERGMELGWDRSTISAEENFLIYNTFAKASAHLSITYPMADHEGRALRPSLLIRQLRRIFPRLQIESDVKCGIEAGLELVSTPGGTFKYLVKNLGIVNSDFAPISHWHQVYEWFKQQDDWTAILNMAEAAHSYRNNPGKIPMHLLSRIYERPVRTSVSRLEKYVRCPFSHFVRYGLKAQERKNYSIEPPDLGDFFHTFMHKFSLEADKQAGGWHELDYPACQAISDRIMDEMIPAYGNNVLESSHRYRFLSNRLKRIGRRVIWTLSQELQRGCFEPWAYEIRFGHGGLLPAIEVKLANGESVLVEGRIDRIDICREEQDIYLRILDYKTGYQDLTLSDVYHGLSLQLIIYMKAALAAYESRSVSVQPAGLFFFHIDDPLVESEERIKEKVEALAARELGFKGLVLNDIKVIRMMDSDAENSSTYLPVTIKKDLTLANRSSALDYSSFMLLLRHVDKILATIGEELSSGNIDIEPIKIGGRTACQNCLYQAICQFDRRLPGNQYRNLRSFDANEVLQRIEKEGGV